MQITNFVFLDITLRQLTESDILLNN